ncbi:MAG: fluoride efflux transporter CrcB [Bacteroidota bacterium]
MTYVWVFVGGGLGSLCRFGLAQWLNRSGDYPWGTLLANGLACIILGVLVGVASKQSLSVEARLLLMTGFCGGFSTFSTFSNELIQMLRQTDYTSAFVYLMLSMIFGLLAILLGMRIAA